MAIQENIKKIERLTRIIEDHLVGGNLSIGTHATYIFHEQYSNLDGIRASLSGGKINALTIIINKLDELYNKEFEWSSLHVNLKSL